MVITSRMLECVKQSEVLWAGKSNQMAVAVASIQRTRQYFNTTIFSGTTLPFIWHVGGITLKLQNIWFQLGQTLKLSMGY